MVVVFVVSGLVQKQFCNFDSWRLGTVVGNAPKPVEESWQEPVPMALKAELVLFVLSVKRKGFPDNV